MFARSGDPAIAGRPARTSFFILGGEERFVAIPFGERENRGQAHSRTKVAAAGGVTVQGLVKFG
jgi:hypothetical protein